MICLETETRRVEATDVEYQVQRKVVATKDSKKRKKGETYWKPYKYCRFLNNALDILHQENLGRSDAKGDYECEQAAISSARRLVPLVDKPFRLPNIDAYDLKKEVA